MDPMTTLLVAVVAAALALFTVFGPQVNALLNAAIFTAITVGLVLAAILSFAIWRQLRTRHHRQVAVTTENVDQMHWKGFEHLAIELLEAQGFKIKHHASAPGDHGADIVATKGRDRYAIQVKHYGRKLDNTPVQEAVAAKAYYKCNQSMVITNSHFTAGAKILAAANGCILIDREELGKWILARR
jgi:HJR/Mrr/RecB family endonuclease